MPQLIVRIIEQEVVRRLKLRAARKGHSAEAEHREILRLVLLGGKPRRNFKELLGAMPDVGDDQDYARTGDPPRDVAL